VGKGREAALPSWLSSKDHDQDAHRPRKGVDDGIRDEEHGALKPDIENVRDNEGDRQDEHQGGHKSKHLHLKKGKKDGLGWVSSKAGHSLDGKQYHSQGLESLIGDRSEGLELLVDFDSKVNKRGGHDNHFDAHED